MKIIKYLFFIILITFIAGSIYTAVQPSDYTFQKSITINAPKQLVFNKVSNTNKWIEFSPWLQNNNATKKNDSYVWNGDVLGEGNIKIITTHQTDSVKQQLNFLKPFTSSATVNWQFKTVNNTTKVDLKISGKKNFMTKLHTVLNGSIEENTKLYFEESLNLLKKSITADMRVYSIEINGITEHSGGFYLYNTTASSINSLPTKMESMMQELHIFTQNNAIDNAGNPFTIYHNWDKNNNSVMFSCALPTANKIITTNNNILTGQLEPFKALKVTLNGDYSNLEETWTKANNYIKQYNLEAKVNGVSIESYLNTPKNTLNPANLKTELFIELN